VGLQEPELEDLKGVDAGMFLMKSITCERFFSRRGETSKSNITLWLVMWLVQNLAFTRANQATGSEIQKAGRVSLLGCGRTASATGGDCWGRNRMLPKILAIQL
jgi:hypothetical protein